MTYYNDNDPYAAAWLRNLVEAGEITRGEVDERSIKEIDGFQELTRCHFFAGIGGWDLALQLAGWPEDVPVWTGSCPCQPFSVAGKRKGIADDRHLWPTWLQHIAKHRPPTIFGEQVASKDGRFWLSGVRADLEALGYAVGAADLCAAGTGAPHIRQRLWWVANSQAGGQQQEYSDIEGFLKRNQAKGLSTGFSSSVCDSGVGNSECQRNEDDRSRTINSTPGTMQEEVGQRKWVRPNTWEPNNYVLCTDGKTRRIEPGVRPLAYGISNRVGKLRAYGNAIVPQVAAEFIRAYMETEAQ